MGTARRSEEVIEARRLLALCALLVSGLLLPACGDSGGSTTDTGPNSAEAAAKAKRLENIEQVRGELKQLKQQYPASDCKGDAFANRQSSCTFAENAELIYYTEIGIGPGTIAPYEPRVKRDIRIRCSGGSPHKCAGRDDRVIYFP